MADYIKEFEAGFKVHQFSVKEFVASFGTPSIVMVKEFDTGFSESLTMLKQFDTGFKTVFNLVKTFETGMDVLDYTRGLARFTTLFRNADMVANIVPMKSVQVLLNGTEVQAGNVKISASESSQGASCTFDLGSLTALATVKRDMPVIITIGSKQYNFIVDSWPSNKQGLSAADATVRCVSPFKAFDEPRHRGITKTWDSPILASEVATELLGSVTWKVIDWVLPAYRLAAENETPAQIVKRLAAACGGIIVPDSLGNPVVQYEFPVATNLYDSVTPDHTYNDVDHIVSDSEESVPQDGTNYLVVSDIRSSSTSGSDRMEFEVLTPNKGTLKVYPSPNRELSVQSTAPEAPVIIEEIGVSTEVISEDLEIYKGEANTEYPIKELVGIEFVSLPITGIQFDEGNSVLFTTSDESYGVITATYKTEVRKYKVSGVTSSRVQFLLLE